MQSRVRSPSLAKSLTLTPHVSVNTKWCSVDKRMCIHHKRISGQSRARLRSRWLLKVRYGWRLILLKLDFKADLTVSRFPDKGSMMTTLVATGVQQ